MVLGPVFRGETDQRLGYLQRVVQLLRLTFVEDADAETAVEEAVVTILAPHGNVGAPAAVDAEASDGC